MKECKKKIHDYFGLSYAKYSIIPRSLLQSMPDEWQEKFVALMDELDNYFDWRREGQFVRFRDVNGKMMSNRMDEFDNYQRGRRIISKRECKKIIENYNRIYNKPF